MECKEADTGTSLAVSKDAGHQDGIDTAFRERAAGVALRRATSHRPREDGAKKDMKATKCAWPTAQFKQARGGPRRQLLVTAGGPPTAQRLRKTRDRSHTWSTKCCTPYPVIGFTKFIANYIVSRDLVPISEVSAGEHANKILAYTLWRQDPYIREHQRYQVRPVGLLGTVE